MSYHYVWLLWSAAFLVPWLAMYAVAAGFRREMLRVSGWTSLLGLTEPIFVPEYWNPPSLFELAQRTGFDVESLIFSFAIGGIGAGLYTVLARRAPRAVPASEQRASRHRFHRLAFAAPVLAFPPLYLLPWNPIYPAITALLIGGAANVLCRPDLLRGTVIGGLLFTVLYALFMALLIAFAPGYIEQVWNLPALSGIHPAGIPLEELAFGFAFGTYWAGIYEHFTWTRAEPLGAGPAPSPTARREEPRT
ncbi:MAG: lycopene cyclase domain-containing protein [Pseudomonadota bacterium]|nr:lycopene cyclase domain-containing protein [Nevskiales bacterium]MEC9363542.1 lycopene cyclase domain-containing protein [Pseudomonadota bacterium]